MVSVIIPIFNVETYIDRGVRQILQQDYKDIEIILVDDGSTDGSHSLCDALAARNAKIRVFHKENGGAGSARNVGIENARGEYIYFFDIDDLADEGLLEYCVRTMDDSDADMMVFSYRNEDVTTGQKYEIVMDDICIKSNDELQNVYVDQFVMKTNGFPWNKMYRKSFLNDHNLRFEDLLIQQDEVFNLNTYSHVNKMVISSKVLYTYYIYNKGNTRSRFIPNRFDIYLTVNERFRTLKQHWQLKDERLDKYMHRRLWGNAVGGYLQNIYSDKCTWTELDKKRELYRISENKEIKECVKSLYTSARIDERIIMKMVLTNSYSLLLCFNNILNTIRKLKTRK